MPKLQLFLEVQMSSWDVAAPCLAVEELVGRNRAFGSVTTHQCLPRAWGVQGTGLRPCWVGWAQVDHPQTLPKQAEIGAAGLESFELQQCKPMHRVRHGLVLFWVFWDRKCAWDQSVTTAGVGVALGQCHRRPVGGRPLLEGDYMKSELLVNRSLHG